MYCHHDGLTTLPMCPVIATPLTDKQHLEHGLVMQPWRNPFLLPSPSPVTQNDRARSEQFNDTTSNDQ